MDQHLVATSKFLSYVLRHNPAAIGVSLDSAGWIGIDSLLAAATAHGHTFHIAANGVWLTSQVPPEWLRQ
ncbi:MAG TPA: RNA 2'-phosphotransferase [Micromonosporaceae bacterium]|jgi:putative RNA 2'-phosphotransferase|nr:RNA 2'-phosphotransferase [Micromonosporaceae bacterium]